MRTTADGYRIKIGDEIYRPTREGVEVFEVVHVCDKGVRAVGPHTVENPGAMFASLTKSMEEHEAIRHGYPGEPQRKLADA